MLESLVAEETFRHGNHPVLSWMANNVEIEYKADGLMKPKRVRDADKIDGIAACLNALAVSLVPADDEPEATAIPFNDDDEPDSFSPEFREYMDAWFAEEEDY
jgi:phage terminase large subunit-like protein